MKKFWLISLVLILSLSLFAERKALLIGNASYSGMTLASPINDINAMEAALGNWGYTIQKTQNLNLQSMTAVIDSFTADIDLEDEIFFYYSGHGVRDNGGNFLVPAGINMQNRQTYAHTAYSVNTLIRKLSGARNAIVLLEACRHWPPVSATSAKFFEHQAVPDSTVSVIFPAKPHLAVNEVNPPRSAFTAAFITKFTQSTNGYNQTIQELLTELRAVPNPTIDPWVSPKALKNDLILNIQNQRFFFKGGAMDLEGGGSLSW